ncbi:MAG: glycosyltransferase, partial [Caenispirillum sp.]|nr:glycosyltransferase [Caenispirillum sp.]
VLHDPLPREALAAVLQGARVMLYPGDLNETFCFAVAEAQALGLPAVVLNQGALPERVRSGETGYVAADDAAFVSDAVRLLRDDALWRKLHRAALTAQRSWTWNDAAAAFERLLPED